MRRSLKKSLSLFLILVSVLTLSLPIFSEEVQAVTNGYVKCDKGSAIANSIWVADQYIKEKGITGKLDAIILSSESSYADALSGSYLAKAVEAPVLLVKNSTLDEALTYIKKKVNIDGTIYILGGTGAVSQRIENSIKNAEYANIVRLGGNNRFETNLLILQKSDEIYKEKYGKLVSNAMVCQGMDYPDALASGAVGNPVLLIQGNQLKDNQKAYLATRNFKNLYLIGGTGVVTTTMEKNLKKYGSTSRYAGNNRYETAAKTARAFFGKNPQEVIVVSGKDYKSGVLAAPLAQAKKCPILLTDKTNLAQSYNYEKTAKIKGAIVIGDIPKKNVALTGAGWQQGWNKYYSSYVFINKDGTMAVSKFNEGGYTVSPSSGGMIAASSKSEISRRQDSARYGTAIVIHISSQKLDYVRSGTVKFTTDVVTGNKGTNDTPKGTYSIRGKSRRINLVGADYVSYVNYWMPFIGNSYGIHDATWRSRFGGSIYKGNGSHGCVNVPYGNMQKLWGLVSVGTKVVIKN